MTLTRFEDSDYRIYVVLATSKNFDLLWHLADEVRKRVYGFALEDWVDHLDDVCVHRSHDHRLIVLESDWNKLPQEDQDLIAMYAQGYVDAARD